MPGTNANASGLRVVFQERGGGAIGIFKSPDCTYNQSWTSVLGTSIVGSTSYFRFPFDRA